MVDKL
jgi:hypothetical protein